MPENKSSSDELVRKFFQAMQTMDNLYEEYAENNGLTFMSLYILETLFERKKCTQKEISDITRYPKQTVNMVIRGFLEKNLVALKTDKLDKRRKLVTLTDLGEIRAKQIFDPFYNATEEAFFELDNGKCAAMVSELSILTQTLTEKVGQLLKNK